MLSNLNILEQMLHSGLFVRSSAVNGLLGLGPGNGPEDMDVLSILASQGIIGNSFSLCFSPNGKGRLIFGDKGTRNQKRTPLDQTIENEAHNVLIEDIVVNQNVFKHVGLTVFFDSGTTFTVLSDPAYTFIAENFNSLIKEPRRKQPSPRYFEYCYDLSQNQSSYWTPTLSLIMKGGQKFDVLFPTFHLHPGNSPFYCLAIIKDDNINIIGQNFMTGYNTVFDREKRIMGWKQSKCKGNQFNVTTSAWDAQASSLPIITRVMGLLFYYFLCT
ncbi:unnamed protein product [Cuscuta epithymum]|uniref:Peptidase A1 domain-containing protein n=1 Tax=Cuscuta epithymum TaxID=186058 RepID=A0AAV0FKJ2_9ASTE|nr:unnamed protein product [Cuscuta epithymum]